MLSVLTTPFRYPFGVHYLVKQDKWRLLRMKRHNVTRWVA
jgi:hypothetical protein